MVTNRFVLGFASCLLLVGCTGASFPYRYYALDADSYAGSLRGPEPKDDVALSQCAPTEANKAPCIVMQTDKFLSAKKDYLDMQNRLIECERGGRKGD